MEKSKKNLLEGFVFGIDTHSFNVSLAKHIGLTEAILMQHFYYMHNVNKEKEGMQKEGRTWFYRSIKSMNETYPYLSTDKIRGAIERLVNGGLIYKADYNIDKFKKTTWYSMSDEALKVFSHEKTKSNLENPKRFGKIPNDLVKYQQDNINIDNNKDNSTLSSFQKDETNPEKVPYKEIVEKYNSLLGGKLPRVTVITDKRKKSMNTCVKQFGIESIDTVFNNVLSSPFLTGDNNKGWKCDFDFIFTASKYVKIMEGNYNGGKKEEDLTEESVRYNNFIQWVKQNAPRVMQMKASLDLAGYRSIKNACTYEEMTRRLKEMNDYDNLLNKFQDPVTTCIKWDEYGNR